MAPTTRRRLLAGSVLGAALSLAGCTFTNPIETLEPYAASDGTRLELADGIRLENVLVLSEAEGAEGHVLGAAVNSTTEPVEITFSVEGEPELVVVVEPDEMLNLSDEGLVVESTPAPPGGMVSTTVSTPQHGAVPLPVPVLDGTLSQYDEHVPER
ncbi:hypothetical protein PU560_10535 [Georgenia sp. 10Sc9-8]|uniref:DNA modification methylase n=1 Tax=Georgenia halotolerans TaxID=3028317 RepID=A0ABT5TXV5_9MICO|nr:hypothetical protein [Georgenia halotolerans]